MKDERRDRDGSSMQGGGYCTHMDRTKRRCLSDLTGCFTHDEVHSHGLLGVNQTR